MASKARGRPWRRRILRAFGWLVLAVVVLTAIPVLVWRWLPPPTTPVMLATAWDHRGTGNGLRYQWVPLSAISPHLQLAVVAAEDQKFPAHRGFDLESMRAAWERHRAGGRLRGASTISQQVSKNLFLWSGRSWLRKALEAWFTVWIELAWPKHRILEVYLNVAQTGPVTFGAEAAARQYFGRPASDLTAEQSALIAAVLPNPVRFRVDAPSAHVRQRQGWIIRQMRNLGGVAYVRNL